jgi:hypothetical protein
VNDIDDLDSALRKIDSASFSQTDSSVFILWYLTDIKGADEVSIEDIVDCFGRLNLGRPNTTYLRRKLQQSPRVVAGQKTGSFKIHRNSLQVLRNNFANVVPSSLTPAQIVRERLDVSRTPFLSPADINNAYKMAELYVATHCLENSVRNLVRQVLGKALGEKWWQDAASEAMKRKVAERTAREQKNRWLTARGVDELHYVDWGDLVTLVRKYHAQFERFIPDVKFIELRLEELENDRNTLAHNGVLPDEEITRVELALRDWCRQVSAVGRPVTSE